MIGISKTQSSTIIKKKKEGPLDLCKNQHLQVKKIFNQQISLKETYKMLLACPLFLAFACKHHFKIPIQDGISCGVCCLTPSLILGAFTRYTMPSTKSGKAKHKKAIEKIVSWDPYVITTSSLFFSAIIACHACNTKNQPGKENFNYVVKSLLETYGYCFPCIIKAASETLCKCFCD